MKKVKRFYLFFASEKLKDVNGGDGVVVKGFLPIPPPTPKKKKLGCPYIGGFEIIIAFQKETCLANLDFKGVV